MEEVTQQAQNVAEHAQKAKEHITNAVKDIEQDRQNIHDLAANLRDAIPNLGYDAFQDCMRKIQLEFRTQGIKATVRTFSGEGARKFADWIKDMKKASTLVDGDNDRLRSLALETLQGSAADFLSRKIKAKPAITFDEIKKVMTEQYSDLADTQLALRQLRKMKQRPDENVQNYAERLIALCDDAFPEHDVNDEHIQKQLVETFTDGVRDNGIARKLIRSRPNTLDSAVETATQEQQTARAFELRREEVPMEIDAIVKVEQTMEKRINDLTSKVDSALAMIVAAVQNQGPQHEEKKPFTHKKKYEFTNSGAPICAYCKKVGHIQAVCRTKKYKERHQEN